MSQFRINKQMYLFGFKGSEIHVGAGISAAHEGAASVHGLHVWSPSGGAQALVGRQTHQVLIALFNNMTIIIRGMALIMSIWCFRELQ